MSAAARNVQAVTANIGKDDSGELVSSRYAVRIGDVDVVLISDGILPLPTSTMSTNASEAERNQWFDNRFLQRDMFKEWGQIEMALFGGVIWQGWRSPLLPYRLV